MIEKMSKQEILDFMDSEIRRYEREMSKIIGRLDVLVPEIEHIKKIEDALKDFTKQTKEVYEISTKHSSRILSFYDEIFKIKQMLQESVAKADGALHNLQRLSQEVPKK